MTIDNYKTKYLKYKQKYLQLKYGGSSNKVLEDYTIEELKELTKNLGDINNKDDVDDTIKQIKQIIPINVLIKKKEEDHREEDDVNEDENKKENTTEDDAEEENTTEDDAEEENTTEDDIIEDDSEKDKFVAKIGIDLTSILKDSTQEQLDEYIDKWINQLEVNGYYLNNLSDNKIINLINQLVENN